MVIKEETVFNILEPFLDAHFRRLIEKISFAERDVSPRVFNFLKTAA